MIDRPSRPLSRRAALELLRQLLAPGLDRALWRARIHKHFHVRIGNRQPTVEFEQGLDQIEWLAGLIDGCDWHYSDVWVRRSAIVVETQFRFRDAAGLPRAIPCVIVARVMGGLLADLRVLVDPAPLFQPIRIR